jgi:hypothetical protein
MFTKNWLTEIIVVVALRRAQDDPEPRRGVESFVIIVLLA